MKCIWQMDGDKVKGFKCEFSPIDMLMIVSGLKYIVADIERHPKDRERAQGIYNQIMLCRYYDEADHKTEATISKMEQVDEPQTCDNCKWGEWYCKGYDITMMDDECGGCCSWNSKWTPKDEPKTQMKTQNSNLTFEKTDEPQTDFLTFLYNVINPNEMEEYRAMYEAKGIATKDEPQTIAEDINRRVEMGKKEWNARHIEDEPQTDCAWR